MKTIRLYVACACAAAGFWIASPFCAAATVFLQVVEAGLGEDEPSPAATSAWEGGAMKAFFEAGHIVFNASASRTPNPAAAAASARDDGADYAYYLVLHYGAAEPALGGKPAPVRSPDSVSYRYMRVDGLAVLDEGSSMPDPKAADEGSSASDELARSVLRRTKGR